MGTASNPRLRSVSATLRVASHVRAKMMVGLDGGVLGRDLHFDGIGQARPLQFGDFAGHGGGEEVGVPFLGYDFEHLIDFLFEVEVEQSIGFVQHQVFESFEMEPFGVGEMIDDPSGCSYHHVGSLPECDGLCHHVHPAHEGGHPNAHPFPQGFELFGDLQGQLSRGRQHECRIAPGRFEQPLQHGDGECGGLSGSGLCQSHHVSTLECVWECRRLYVGGSFPSQSSYGFPYGFAHSQPFEGFLPLLFPVHGHVVVEWNRFGRGGGGWAGGVRVSSVCLPFGPAVGRGTWTRRGGTYGSRSIPFPFVSVLSPRRGRRYPFPMGWGCWDPRWTRGSTPPSPWFPSVSHPIPIPIPGGIDPTQPPLGWIHNRGFVPFHPPTNAP
eukprot:scaffold1146_cov339-Pavlova_lutheri.AAC.14